MLLSEVLQFPKDLSYKIENYRINPIHTNLPNPFGYRGKQYVEHDGYLFCYKIGEKVKKVRNKKTSDVWEIAK